MKTLFEWAVACSCCFASSQVFLTWTKRQSRSVRGNKQSGTPLRKIGATSKLMPRTTQSKTGMIITMCKKGRGVSFSPFSIGVHMIRPPQRLESGPRWASFRTGWCAKVQKKCGDGKSPHPAFDRKHAPPSVSAEHCAVDRCRMGSGGFCATEWRLLVAAAGSLVEEKRDRRRGSDGVLGGRSTGR